MWIALVLYSGGGRLETGEGVKTSSHASCGLPSPIAMAFLRWACRQSPTMNRTHRRLHTCQGRRPSMLLPLNPLTSAPVRCLHSLFHLNAPEHPPQGTF